MTSGSGFVYLVGGGPGDPELLTLKGRRLLEEADAVVYDRLVDQRILGHTRRGAEFHDGGKGQGRRGMSQEEINDLLVSLGRQGKRVVRLKGGDPFVFGRGGEEALALVEAGIPFEVVPGVTSAVAVPAYAGIPLTHRGIVASFMVVSGSEDPAKEESFVDWEQLASSRSTLVVLMGWNALPGIVDALVQYGRDPETPVALVRWGTEPHQETVVGTLSTIVDRAREAQLAPPVVAVIGQVVDLREKLRWFDNRPLSGKRVLVTRARTQASALAELLSREGAQAVELPTIEIRPPESLAVLGRALEDLGRYGWVVFTSANGVGVFFNRLSGLHRDARALAGVAVAAIGPATAQALESHGIRADLLPERFTTEGVLEVLRQREDLVRGRRVLLPRADIAGRGLSEGLEALGAEVEDIAAYRTALPAESRERAQELLVQPVDVVTFTSSSTVENLVSLLGDDMSAVREACVACIGPITARTAERCGLRVDVVAEPHTIPGLVRAIRNHFSQQGAYHGDFS